MTLAAPDDLVTEEGKDAKTAQIGPIRDPDACVLDCPDCACRRRLEEHLAGREGDHEELSVQGLCGDVRADVDACAGQGEAPEDG